MGRALILDLIIVILVFFLGLIANSLVNSVTYVPYSTSAVEQISPADHITLKHINLYEDKLVLNLDNMKLVSFEDTNSMDPVIDVRSNAIEIMPKSPSDIGVGDIISFKTESGQIFIHRVVAISSDSEGIYYLTKGDNNKELDPVRVRFANVVGLLVGILY